MPVKCFGAETPLGHSARPQAERYSSRDSISAVVTGVTQMLFITPAGHRAVRSGDDVNAPRAKGDDECVLHCILVSLGQPGTPQQGRQLSSRPPPSLGCNLTTRLRLSEIGLINY